jgi:phage-related protein
MASGPGGTQVGRVSIKVVPDTDKFKAELLAQLKKIQKDLKIEIPVDFDTKRATAQLAVLKKRIDSLDKNVDINVNEDSIRNLNKIGDAAGNAGSGFSSMSRFALIGVAVLVLLAPALALIATLLAGLPSLLFLAGAGFAAIALGMEGIGNAAKVFEPSITSLKKALSETFQTGLTPIFEQLNGIFPTLEQGLVKVAEGLIVMAQGFTDVVTSARGMAQIETFLANTGKFFEQITPGIRAFTDTLLTLASEGSKLFGELAGVFNTFVGQFNAMIQAAVATGTFQSAIKGLAQVSSALLDVFTKLFGAGLAAMGQLAGPLSSLFTTFGDALVALMPALTALTNLVSTVLAEAFRQLIPIFASLMPGFTLLAQVVGTLLVEAFKILGPLLTTVGGLLSTVVVAVLQALIPLIPPLAAALTLVAQVLGEMLVQAITFLMPLFEALLKFIVDLAIALLPLIPPLVELAQVVFQALIDILTPLMPLFMRLATEVLPLVTEAVTALIPGITSAVEWIAKLVPPIVDVVTWILDKMIPVFNALLSVVIDVWPAIQDIIQGAVDFIAGVIQVFASLVTGDWEGMWEGIKKMASAALDILLGVIEGALRLVVSSFIGLFSEVAGIFGDAGRSFRDSGKALIQGLIDGIKSMIGAARDAIGGVVDAIKNFLPFSPAKEGPFSGRGYTTYSGQALIEDFAKGMASAAPAAVAAIEDILGQSQNALEIEAAVQSDGFGSIGDRVAQALSGWTVEMDAQGVTSLVNRTNTKNKRR